MDFNKDYYKILDVSPSADFDEIRRAFIKKVKSSHPDLGGSTALMQELNEAYEVLKNAEERKNYDVWFFSHHATNTEHSSTYNKDVTVHILDYDFGYRSMPLNSLNIAMNISLYLYDNNLYAYTKLINNKKCIKIIEYDTFCELLKLYHAETIPCKIVKNSLNLFVDISQAEDVAPTSFQNNYKAFLTPHTDFVYAKKEGEKLYAISQDSYLSLIESCKLRKDRFSKIALFAFIAIVLFFAVRGSHDSDNTSSSAKPATTTAAKESPPVRAPLAHNELYYASNSNTNNIIIKTSSGVSKYYYVKFEDVSSKKLVQGVFIHAGSITRLYLPSGEYNLKWTSGDTWYGFGAYFNNNSAQIADESFSVEYGDEWTFTLYGVQNGNMDSNYIDIEDF